MGEICFQIFMILRLKSGVCALAYQSSGHFFTGLGAPANSQGLTFWLAWAPRTSLWRATPCTP